MVDRHSLVQNPLHWTVQRRRRAHSPLWAWVVCVLPLIRLHCYGLHCQGDCLDYHHQLSHQFLDRKICHPFQPLEPKVRKVSAGMLVQDTSTSSIIPHPHEYLVVPCCIRSSCFRMFHSTVSFVSHGWLSMNTSEPFSWLVRHSGCSQEANPTLSSSCNSGFDVMD